MCRPKILACFGGRFTESPLHHSSDCCITFHALLRRKGAMGTSPPIVGVHVRDSKFHTWFNAMELTRRQDMCQSEKKRRKVFLNDLCAICGIVSTDHRRRSDAAIVFIAHGEEKCRAWLRQAAGDYKKWETMVDIKHAKKIVSRRQKQKEIIRRAVSRSTYHRGSSRRTRDSQCQAHDNNVGGTVCPDGSGSGWRDLSRSQEYGLANRM